MSELDNLLRELAGAERQCEAHTDKYYGKQDMSVPYDERPQEYRDSWDAAWSRREAAIAELKRYAKKHYPRAI